MRDDVRADDLQSQESVIDESPVPPIEPEEIEAPLLSPALGFTDEEFEEVSNQPSPDSGVQQTLFKAIVVEGSTHHSDIIAVVRVRPAFAGEGRYFVRVPEGTIPLPSEEDRQPAEAAQDAESVEEKKSEEAEKKPEPDEVVPMGGGENVIKATIENVVLQPEDCLWPTLLGGEDRIMAADALLSALEACGVDNARIEVEGNGELPVYDGSAAGWVEEIKAAGLRPAPKTSGSGNTPTQRLAPPKVVMVREGESFISLIPGSSSRLSYGIDQSDAAAIIGSQWATWAPTDRDQHHYRWAVAPARHYFTSPQERLDRMAQGYFKVADTSLTAIADEELWLDFQDMRYGYDEPSRRRLLELVADLSLLSKDGRGGVPSGHIVAFNASRNLHLKFVRAVLRVCGEPLDQ